MGDSAPIIKANVEKLGFKMADVKILTATHGHFDHVAAMADLKKMTGASLVVMEQDKDLFETEVRPTFAGATRRPRVFRR